MKNYYDTEKKCYIAIDGEVEFTVTFCGMAIAGWKKRYFRKNSKKPAKVRLRCNYGPSEQMFWKYFIELELDGKTLEQTRITKETYDQLARDKPTDNMGQIEFIDLEKFIPIKN
mgnify:CR=1 FL=1